MRMRHATLVLVLVTASAGAQQPAAHGAHISDTRSAEIAEFVAAARRGSELYRDRNAAIAAGFRRLGGDFPSMGEHWAHPGKVIAGRFDVADPPMLTYANIEGKPVLLGVVYAVPLERGEHPPALPGGINAWHEHNGTVDEESFLPEHGGDHSAMHAGTRLAILHVWTLLPNPAGDFAAENWALPFARLHLRAPALIPEGAARALSLLSGAGEFYSNLLEAELPAGSQGEWRSALEAARVSGLDIVAATGTGDTIRGDKLDALEKSWFAFVGLISKRNPQLARRLGGGGNGRP